MKFIHLADAHLDMPFTSIKNNRDLVKRRHLEQKFIFKRAIDLAKEENVEAIFIAGDLFEDKYVQKETINYIISLFNEISDIKVYITPGNHDPLIKSSPYNTYNWPDNVFIFSNEVGMDTFDNVNIYGVGFNDFEMDTDVIKDIKIEEDKINILITHGTLDGASHKYHDIKSEWLSKFDYVALGHIHLPKIDNTKIIYPGSLIAGGFDEPGEHGLIIGNITKENLDIKFVRVDSEKFETKVLDISNFSSINEIIDKLELKEDFYKIVLTGTKNVEIEKLKEALNLSGKKICDVEDKTHNEYNLEEISKQKNLKGVFTKRMLDDLNNHREDEEKIMKAIEYVYNNI